MNISYFACIVLLVFGIRGVATATAANAPEAPRVDSVVMVDPQPHEADPSVIWYDDFDDRQKQDRYPEGSGQLSSTMHFGASGKSLRMRYPKGERGEGGRKLFFGDTPTYQSQAVRSGESFEDVYWRIYVKHPSDWQGGGPAKLSRATSLLPGWKQAMIAHVWSSGEALTLDPATGVEGNEVLTTRYNDFPNLDWLGNRPASKFKLHGADGLGWWVCVEARAKLNTPGKEDGLQQLWIDGRLEAERQGLDWRGSFTERGINAVFLEAYWNEGSPVDQSRWIDNFVVSTEPIGPVVCSPNPTLIKTPYHGPGDQQAWEAEIAATGNFDRVVWRSGTLTNQNRVTVNSNAGEFVGRLARKQELETDTIYFSRVRQQSSAGVWSRWSPWHQPIRTAETTPLHSSASPESKR